MKRVLILALGAILATAGTATAGDRGGYGGGQGGCGGGCSGGHHGGYGGSRNVNVNVNITANSNAYSSSYSRAYSGSLINARGYSGYSGNAGYGDRRYVGGGTTYYGSGGYVDGGGYTGGYTGDYGAVSSNVVLAGPSMPMGYPVWGFGRNYRGYAQTNTVS